MRLDRYLELVSPMAISRLLEIEVGIKEDELSQKSFFEYISREAVRRKQQEGSFDDHYDWLIMQANKWHHKFRLNFL